MFESEYLKEISEDLFTLRISKKEDFKILQLTDLHLGFGPLSRKKDKLALRAIKSVVRKGNPDLIVLTGDSIFPFLPKAGTMDNRRQARILTEYMDLFKIPYTFVFGNHDCEMGSSCKKEELAQILAQGKYCIMTKGKQGITGCGNFIINLVDKKDKVLMPLVMLDSNMYGDGWFYSGFDCIHDDQVEWCMDRLEEIKADYPKATALAFFHMPLKEFKDAYEKMKLGSKSVIYNHGSIGERDDYFGISKNKCIFFDRALENGMIKGMFCGHDHLNTLSLIYKGIMMTYGMSIDYLGYKNIDKKNTQRGGTLITRKADGSFTVDMVPLTSVVSKKVKGENK